jgi:hypothetical protein
MMLDVGGPHFSILDMAICVYVVFYILFLVMFGFHAV